MDGNIKIVIGSWGSYNECNERALGSKWLDLSRFTDWEQITDELKDEGFILDGIDEELFIQDVEGLPSGCKTGIIPTRKRYLKRSMNRAF